MDIALGMGPQLFHHTECVGGRGSGYIRDQRGMVAGI